MTLRSPRRNVDVVPPDASEAIPTLPSLLMADGRPDEHRSVASELREQSFSVRRTHSLSETLVVARELRFDAIILGHGFKDGTALALCQSLRAQPPTRSIPIVMLTETTDDAERVQSLQMGADDCLARPFHTRELALRLRTLLRPRTTTAESCTIGALHVDFAAHRVWVNDTETILSAHEFRILSSLIACRPMLVRREVLGCLWTHVQSPPSNEAISTALTRLRNKLGDAGTYIRTRHHQGYQFVYP